MLKPPSTSRHNPPQAAPLETVDPRWLLKAGAVVFAFALLCVLALFWTTFYYTQWQYVLAPSRSVASNPSADGLSFSEVHFGVDATGQPQLDGWLIPADTPTNPTVLLLHDGKGSMSDALPQARNLHETNLNVLLFDYRGFGHSGGAHPTQTLMQVDAESALNYLRDTRHIDLSHIVIYGDGLGASLAVSLCAEHHEIPAVILESPLGDTEPQVLHDTRTDLVPVRMLFHEQFPLAAPLQTLATPKLLIITEESGGQEKLRQAADPKTIVTFGFIKDDELRKSIRRFLDSYVANP
jgi:pimeloyl-ACP methyl ester carboxylesterase